MKVLAIISLLVLFSSAMTLSRSTAQSEGRFSVAGLKDDREVEQFFIVFKNAVAKSDKKKTASLISYPIIISLSSGRRAYIKNEANFERRYNGIFDETF